MVAYTTAELGPQLGYIVDDFELYDCEKHPYSISTMIGQNGLLMGFIGDIWNAASVRRILWLQHHMARFVMMGVPVALLVQDHASTLYGFRMSSATPVPFPMLADEDGRVHVANGMERHPGLLLLDTDYSVRRKWLMPPDRVWPKAAEIARAIEEITPR